MSFWRSWNSANPRWKAWLLPAAAGVALLAGVAVGNLPSADPAKAKDVLIAFSLPDIQGKRRHIKEWQGRLLVLNFWATWCAPCREEIPLLMRMQRQYGQRGLQVIGIALDQPEAVAAYQKEMEIDYPLLIGNEAFDLARQYGNRLNALPFNVVIAPDGRIVARKLGAYSAAELEALIYPHLQANMR